MNACPALYVVIWHLGPTSCIDGQRTLLDHDRASDASASQRNHLLDRDLRPKVVHWRGSQRGSRGSIPARACTVSLPWIVGWCRYRGRVPTDGESMFSAWSFLSLTSTAHGDLAYPDELGVRWDTNVPNGRYVAVGDLAVVRDNRYVFGAGWELTASRSRLAARSGTGAPTAGAPTSSTAASRNSRTGAPSAQPSSTSAMKNNLTYRYSRRTTPGRSGWPTGHSPLKRWMTRTWLDPSSTRSGTWTRGRPRPVLEAHLVTGEPWWQHPYPRRRKGFRAVTVSGSANPSWPATIPGGNARQVRRSVCLHRAAATWRPGSSSPLPLRPRPRA